MAIRIVRDDITHIECDAIVNSTNEKLIGAGGADFAVHRAAGEMLDRECSALVSDGFRLKKGECIVTGGYNLPSGYIIHVCSPKWNRNGRSDAMIRRCYTECMERALYEGYDSVAFPLIASGVNGCPKYRAIELAMDALDNYRDCGVDIILVMFEKEAVDAVRKYTALTEETLLSIDEFISDNYTADYFSDESRNLRRKERENLNFIGRFNAKNSVAYEESICEDFAPSDVGMTGYSAEESEEDFSGIDAALPMAVSAPSVKSAQSVEKVSLSDIEKMKKTDGFGNKLMYYIDLSGEKDSDIYNRASISKGHMSKIRKHPNTYRPKKETVAQFVLALRLNEEDARILFESAGYSLGFYHVFDKIIIWCLRNKIYNLMEVNELLERFDQKELGTIA